MPALAARPGPGPPASHARVDTPPSAGFRTVPPPAADRCVTDARTRAERLGPGRRPR